MREILFRGKCLFNCEWVIGDLLHEPFGVFVQHVTGSSNGYERKKHQVYAETVGQYTGLDDKNGVKIFEGDILNIKLVISHDDFTHTEIRRKWRSSVIYENGTFKITEEGETYPLCEYILSGINQAWFEVIGNIHDNQELLHEEETP